MCEVLLQSRKKCGTNMTNQCPKYKWPTFGQPTDWIQHPPPTIVFFRYGGYINILPIWTRQRHFSILVESDTTIYVPCLTSMLTRQGIVVESGGEWFMHLFNNALRLKEFVDNVQIHITTTRGQLQKLTL